MISQEDAKKMLIEGDINNFEVEFWSDLVVLYEKGQDEGYVGRKVKDEYVVMPNVGLDIINVIREKSLADAVSIYGDEVDLVDFMKDLIDLNYISRINEENMENDVADEEYGISFGGIKSETAKLFFNRGTAIVFVITVVIALIIQLFVVREGLLPTYEEYFWHDSLFVVVLITPLFDLITGIIHELFHFLANRAFSDNAGYFSIGRRLLHIVYQCKITNIWTMERKHRYVTYLAGIMIDIFLISIFMIIGNLSGNTMPMVRRFSRFAILFLEFGVFFQFRFYMKTDIYYIISDFLRKPTLYEDSVQLLKKIFTRKKEMTIEKTAPVIIYAFMILLGSFVDIFCVVWYGIPAVIVCINRIINMDIRRLGLNDCADILSILFIVVEVCVVIYLFIRDKVLQGHHHE